MLDKSPISSINSHVLIEKKNFARKQSPIAQDPETANSINHNHDRSLYWSNPWNSNIALGEMQDSNKPVSGEIALFRAVIMQALLDSVSNSKRTEDKVAKNDAIQWFSSDNEDFITICNLAQLSHVWVLKKSLEAISKGCVWKKECKKGK